MTDPIEQAIDEIVEESDYEYAYVPLGEGPGFADDLELWNVYKSEAFEIFQTEYPYLVDVGEYDALVREINDTENWWRE